MEPLITLRDLQSTLDYLATIHRELSALPPDLAILDTKVKAAEKQIAEKTKALETARAQILVKSKELTQAQRDEDRARAVVKTTSQKVQYTAAIRELDEKERLKASVARPLKALESIVQVLEQALAVLEKERSTNSTRSSWTSTPTRWRDGKCSAPSRLPWRRSSPRLRWRASIALPPPAMAGSWWPWRTGPAPDAM